MITPNAMHARNSLGGGKQLAAAGEPGQPPVLRDYKTGAVVREAEQPAAIQAKYGENFYHLHRCDLHRVLSEAVVANDPECVKVGHGRSEEHTSELQALMSISYAVFCLKKKKTTNNTITQDTIIIYK